MKKNLKGLSIISDKSEESRFTYDAHDMAGDGRVSYSVTRGKLRVYHGDDWVATFPYKHVRSIYIVTGEKVLDIKRLVKIPKKED